MEAYIKCIRKRCKAEESAEEAMLRAAKLMDSLGPLRPPTEAQLEELERVAGVLEKSKGDLKRSECALKECGSQWLKMRNAETKRVASDLREVIKLVRSRLKG
jgi:hypothetical protein